MRPLSQILAGMRASAQEHLARDYGLISLDAREAIALADAFAPIGEDQSKHIVKELEAHAAAQEDQTSPLVYSLIEAAAHISRTSGSAGREMPTHKVRICQSDEEVCPFLLDIMHLT